MIHIGIDPILLTIGPFVISWHGLMIALGVLAAIWLTSKLATQVGFTEDQVYSVALWAIPSGIVGARLFHVIDQWSYYRVNPARILLINEGGIAVLGGLIVGTLVAIIYTRMQGWSVPRLADATAPGITLGQAIGRIGDIINGEHIATPTDLPWGVTYTHPNSPGRLPYATHPEVAYELLLHLAILGALFLLRGRLRPGMGFIFYAATYSLGRFFLSFLRVDTIVAFGLRQAQIILLIVFIACIVLTALIYRTPAQPARAARRQARRRAAR